VPDCESRYDLSTLLGGSAAMRSRVLRNVAHEMLYGGVKVLGSVSTTYPTIHARPEWSRDAVERRPKLYAESIRRTFGIRFS
jgi:hypothetical protein